MKLTKLAPLAFLTLFLLSACSDSVTDPADDAEDAIGILLSVNGTEVARSENGVVTGLVSVPLSEDIQVDVQLILEDETLIAPDDSDRTIEVTVAETSIVGARDGDDSWHFELDGLSAGSTTIVVEILHGSHSDFTSPPIPVTVS